MVLFLEHVLLYVLKVKKKTEKFSFWTERKKNYLSCAKLA